MWVKLSDDAARHPKLLSVSLEARWLWITGLCYAGQYLTDGALPAAAFPESAATGELEKARLWHATGSGWQIHDFLDRNPSRVEVDARRAAETRSRSAGGKGRAATAVRSKGKFTPLRPDQRVAGETAGGYAGEVAGCAQPGPSPSPSPSLGIHLSSKDAVEAQSASPSPAPSPPSRIQLRAEGETKDASVFKAFPAKDRATGRRTVAEVYPGYVEELQAAFPGVNASDEVAKAAEWATQFPEKAKVRVNQFLRGWLRRTEKRASLRRASTLRVAP